VLKRAALLALVLVTAGCGSAEKAGRPQPVEGIPAERHLVYEKLAGQDIWIADAGGGNPRLLARNGRTPVISPDGRWVAYVGCDDEDRCAGTFVVSTSGGKPRKVSTDMGLGPRVADTWSPDSKRLVLLRGGLGQTTLVSIDVASGKELILAKDSPGIWSFAPDGKQIVYARTRGGEASDLFVVDSTGGEPKQITHTGDALEPVWGAKGIAFAREVEKGDSFGDEIWQVQPDGSGIETITGPLRKPYLGDGGNGSEGLVPVSWSENGRALLGAWLLGSDSIPIAVDADGGKFRALAGAAEYMHTFDISADGRTALVSTFPPIGGWSDDTATVLIVPYAGGRPTVVAHGAATPSWNR
jgi:dipeptidyl aminopeptidase/acylaminoacyl peptidase